MNNIYIGQTVRVKNEHDLIFTHGEPLVKVKEFRNGGVIVENSTGRVGWLFIGDVEPVRSDGLKNKYEIKKDIGLIYINRKGYEHIMIVDAEDIPLLDDILVNRINLDTGGYPQHRRMIDGVWHVEQIHRLLVDAKEHEVVIHKNGNRLDCRKANLVKK